MTSFIAKEYGKVIILHLSKGDLVLENIQKAMEQHQIKNAILTSAIGSLRKLSMHVIMDTNDNATNKFLIVEKPLELSSMQGLILNGIPHFHMVCSAPGNEIYAGHVELGCEVQYLLEVSLLEIADLQLMRLKDEFGIDYITAL